VTSLDRATADLVLDQMDAEQARQVRQAIMDLTSIDPQEQREIVAEFRRCRAPSRGVPSTREPLPGVEIDGELAKKFVPPSLDRPKKAATGGRAAPEDAEPAPSSPPFRFLREAEADRLARVLAAERPQTIALVLSHMPPQRAGNVLARLSAALQVDVIRRLVDLEETDPQILREVERGLQSRLSEQVRMQRRRVAGLSAVAGILEACDQQVGTGILENLSRHDRQLAERLHPGGLEFTDLVEADDESLGVTLRAADGELIQLALVGAPPEWIDRFLGLIPGVRARQIRRDLDHLGPTRLSDVEEARQRLAALARHLAAQRRIRLPSRPTE
jgi:flagellar motor switch protein FliG